MDETHDANAALGAEIERLEKEIGLIQCTAVYPEPEPPAPVIEPAPPPVVAAPEPEIDREEWANRDIGVLEGCWELESAYRTRNQRTGQIKNYNEWTMCFEANGAGREEMRSTVGTTCSGPVSGAFSAAGELVITEPGNLPCSDGELIGRRVVTCELLADGRAQCVSLQPQNGSSSAVGLRRSGRTF